jgi:hypothetical protein
MEFGLEITGERAVNLRFEQFPAFAHDRLKSALERIKGRLLAAVLADEPDKTGALRAQTGGKVYDHGDRIAAVVGVRAKDKNEARKAASLEYGSTKVPFAVKAHKASLDHLWSRAIAPISVNVPDHQRAANVTARRFLRGPIDAIRSEAIGELRAALDQALQDASR